MPIPTQAELDEFIKEHGPYRLGCGGGCFRDDFDGVKELPADWEDIREERSLKDALTTYDDPDDEPPGFSISDWETHFGLCPDCQPASVILVDAK
jgi:hypothetical protein